MSLQMVIGGAGTDRSETMYRNLIEESLKYPEKNFFLVVPEQYTMQTQMKMVELHPGHGVMNIDVVSFPRLAYRVFDEVGGIRKTILEDTGKSMVIRRLLSENKDKFKIFTGSIGKSGFVGEAKSMISELFQYSIQPEQLETGRKQIGENSILGKKLNDIQLLYEAFKHYMSNTYMTAEELLDVLADKADEAAGLKGSVMYIENFTGFTPSQYTLLEKLLKICEKIVIGLTIDVHDQPYELGQEYQLFYLTKETLHKLKRLCFKMHIEEEQDLLLSEPAKKRSDKADLCFMEKHLFRFHKYQPWKENPEHIKIYALDHPAEEIRFAATEIRRRVMEENLSYKDFALITADIEQYSETARRRFHEMNIPLFIDDKSNISKNSFVEMLRSAMDVVLKDFSYESIFRYLRSGYTLLEPEEVDRLDNYLLAVGIRGKKRWQTDFIKRYRDYGEEDFLKLNLSREKLVNELQPLFIMSHQAAAADYTQALQAFIEGIDGKGQLEGFAEEFEESGDFVHAREYKQVYDAVEDLLDKCSNILQDEKLNLKEYMEILEAGFGEIQVGVIPPTLDQVVLGDLKRTRLGDVRILFLIGCNDGILPTPVTAGGLISDREKEVLAQSQIELAPTGKQNSFREKFYIYTGMIKPEDELILTFSRMDGNGKSLRPSTILKDVQKIFPALEPEMPNFQEKRRILAGFEESSRYLLDGLRYPEKRDSLWQSLYAWYFQDEKLRERLKSWTLGMFGSEKESVLSRQIIEAIYGKRPAASITTLEKYAACAYAHFLSAGLKLKERETYELLPPDLGNILHKSMERFSKCVTEGPFEWKDMPDDYREETIEQCVREVGMEYQSAVFLDNARYGYYLEKLIRLAKRTVWTIQKQICKGSFIPKGFETHFSLNGKIKLIGNVDRYDIYDGPDERAIRIIDYKSGKKEFDLSEIFYGLSIQLVVYLEAMAHIEEGEVPGKPLIKAGMFYYHMNDPLLEQYVEDPEVREDELASLLKLEGLLDSDPKVVSWMDSELKKAPHIIPVGLKKDGSYTKNSSVADSEQIRDLECIVNNRIMQLQKNWMAGDISVNPYLMTKGSRKETACDYCCYQGICRFDEKLSGCEYRRLIHLSDEEIWEKINEEVKKSWKNHGQMNKDKSSI